VSEIPVALAFDVEPDARLVDRSAKPRWEGFERMCEVLPPLRERLSEITGRPAAFTHYLRMDPQIEATYGAPTWIAEAYGDQLAELTQAGDELGIHTHPWRWDAGSAQWAAEYGDLDWAEQCLATGLDAYEAAFGRNCVTHHSGDRYLTGGMLRMLETRGVAADLTVEPGMPPTEIMIEGESANGTLPDYRHVPPDPYRSTPERFPAPDPAGHGPLLIPLHSAPGRRLPFGRKPLPPTRPGGLFKARLAADRMLRSPKVIAWAVRSDAAIGGEWQVMETNVEHVARRRPVAFTTAAAAAARVESEGQPSN
jgi:hypothetical protein